MYRWIVRKRQRDTRRLAEQHDQNVKAWLLIPDRTWTRPRPGLPMAPAQQDHSPEFTSTEAAGARLQCSLSIDKAFARRQGSAHLNALRLFAASRLELASGINLGRS